MSATEIILLIIGIAVATVVLIWFAIPTFIKLAQKKGWNISAILQKITSGVDQADLLTDALVKLSIPGATIFDKIVDVTREAVGYAEQIMKTGQISPEQRYDEAKQAILAGLKLAEIPEDKINDPAVQEVIEIVLQSSVNGLGHKPELTATTNVINCDPTVAAKAATEQME
jgi:hypothetical protein